MHSHRFFTSCPPPLLALAAGAGLILCTCQLEAQESRFHSGPVGVPASLQGQVVNASGQPLSDTRIELRTMTGRVISSTWAGVSGSFYISNLESGVYEVIASSGIDQSIETVNISCMETQLTLQMGSSRSPNHTGGTVSVAALSVPSDARKAYEKAVRLLQKNDMAGAWNQLNTALQMWPKYAEALTLRGALKLQRNGLQDAMRDFAAALESDRGYPLAYVGLAAGYNMTERFDDALRILDQAASLKIQSWQAHYETSKALLGKKMFDRALQEASQAGKVLGQDLPSINIVKARAYIGLKNTNSATAELQRLLQRKKTGPEADESRALLASMGTSLPK